MQLFTDCLGARDTAGPPHHCSWDCRPQLSDVSDATEVVSPSLRHSSNIVHHILHSQPCNQESAQIYLDDQRLLGAVAHGAQGRVAEGVDDGQQHGADRGRNRHVQLRALRLGGRVGRRRGVKGGRAPLAAPQPGVLRQVQGACTSTIQGPTLCASCEARSCKSGWSWHRNVQGSSKPDWHPFPPHGPMHCKTCMLWRMALRCSMGNAIKANCLAVAWSK